MSNLQPKQSTLTGLTCFCVLVSQWSGRKKLRKEDLKGTAAENLPPEDLASLGSKKIIDNKDLKVFDTIKKRVERKLSSIGISFEGLGAYAIPDDQAEKVAKILDDAEAEFKAHKASFISEYNDHIQKWIDAHPTWEHIIRNYTPQAVEVEGKIQFSWRCFKVVAAVADISSPLNKGLTKDVGGLAGQLYKETAIAAQRMLENVTAINTWRDRTLSPLRQIRQKLDGLSFLDSGVQYLTNSIDHILTIMSGKGPFTDVEVSQAIMLLNTLADEKRMRDHIQLVRQGAQISAIFAAPAPAAKSQPAVVQEEQTEVGSTPNGLLDMTTPVVMQGSEGTFQASAAVNAAQPVAEDTPSGFW